ncbi:MAG TPA: GntR family transcriptional regulator [Marmoricola sp.]|nr:GntR family transcriptional regulator [Marmoricola sp.]
MASDPVSALGPTGREVRRRILSLVQRGSMEPGDKLEAERDLAARLGVSRATLRSVLIALEEEGVVRRVPGRGGGTFVASAKFDRTLSSITGVPLLLREQGFSAGTRVLSVQMTRADEDAAEALGLADDAFVVDLVRIRLADGVPISLERAVLPAELVPGLPDHQLTESLYELLAADYDLRPAEALEHLEVVRATADQAALLGIEPGEPLMLITRTTNDAEGVVFEYSQDYFRADRIRVSVRVQGTEDGVPRLRGRRVVPLPPPDLRNAT